MRRRILVILDDSPEWLDNYRWWLSPLLRKYHVEIAAFTDDRDAAAFVCARREQIIGYLQDVGRSPEDHLQRHGIAFLEAIMRFLTPHVPVIVSSASVTREEAIYFAWSDNVAWVFVKGDRTLREELPSRVEESVLRKINEHIPAPPLRLPDADVDLLGELSVPWRSVRRFLGANPEMLHKLPPRDF
jgi:hypothetical protein